MFLTRLILILALAAAVFPSASAVKAQGRRAMSLGRPKQEKPAKPPKVEKAPKPDLETAKPNQANALDRFKQMSPEKRERELAKLPPARAEELKRRLDNYEKLTPAQRAQADWFSHLPPERKATFRSAFQQFQQQPVERQQAMRQEMNHFRTMTPEARQARLTSPDFKAKFNAKEQQVLGSMGELLPPKE